MHPKIVIPNPLAHLASGVRDLLFASLRDDISHCRDEGPEVLRLGLAANPCPQ